MGIVKLLFIYHTYDDRGKHETEYSSGVPRDQVNYQVEKLQTISFDGQDCMIAIDTSKKRIFSDWEQEQYPSAEVKNKVLEIVYLAHKGMELNELARRVESIPFDKRYELRPLGEAAIELVKCVPDTFQHITYNYSEKGFGFLIVGIRQTLRMEITAIENMPSKLSEIQRFTFKTNRRRLAADIEQAAFSLNYYELNQ